MSSCPIVSLVFHTVFPRLHVLAGVSSALEPATQSSGNGVAPGAPAAAADMLAGIDGTPLHIYSGALPLLSTRSLTASALPLLDVCSSEQLQRRLKAAVTDRPAAVAAARLLVSPLVTGDARAVLWSGQVGLVMMDLDCVGVGRPGA